MGRLMQLGKASEKVARKISGANFAEKKMMSLELLEEQKQMQVNRVLFFTVFIIIWFSAVLNDTIPYRTISYPSIYHATQHTILLYKAAFHYRME